MGSLHWTTPDVFSNIIFVSIGLLLVLLNAFFVAAEFGMVKLRNTQVKKLEELHGTQGKILAEIHQHLDAYLSACQLGITLASLGLGWIGEPALAYLLHPVFEFLNMTSPQLIKAVSFAAAFTILAFLHIVIGELMPKSLAIRKPETISLWTAIPLYGFYWLMYPAIWLLNACSNLMLNMMRLNKVHHGEHFYSTEEIKLVLTSSHLHGEISEEESEIIEHTLDLADLYVSEIMRPRDEIVALNIEDPIQDSLNVILQYRYSRYPVYETNKLNIIGLLHIKDLFSTLYQEKDLVDLRPMIRPVLKVSHELPALNLLRKFRLAKTHFAIIYKEKDLPIGFITLDNLLQILIGKVQDEFHKTRLDWQRNEDGSLTVNGDCSIYSLERALGREIELTEEEEENANTITGLIFYRLSGFPKEGERVEFKEFNLIVEKIEGTKIGTVRIIPK